MINEIKEKIKLEIRSDLPETGYFEAVVNKKDLDSLAAILAKHLGPAAKEPGKNAKLPKEIQKAVDSFGGLRKEQSFYYTPRDGKTWYAALWPWQSDPEKITLKTGLF